MSEEMLVKYGAPTLAGLKTGNLISYPYGSLRQVTDDLRNLNIRLRGKGIRLIPLKYLESRVLVYVYRPSRLKCDFENEETGAILKKFGYPYMYPDKCVALLADKLNNSADFPHEIGLFLSYPPEDVLGFIENKAEGCKCVGCWKVYGDEGKAMKTFAKYRKCTDVYCEMHRKGAPLEKLTITS